MNFDVKLDLNRIIESVKLNELIDAIMQSQYGMLLLSILLVFFLLIIFVYFVAKSGFLSGVVQYQEYKLKKVNDDIDYQESLLNDSSFKKYENKIKYNLEVAKLCKLLNYNHHDKDLLEYMYLCKNSKLAIQLYESSKFQLEKDKEKGFYRLKKIFPNWWVMTLNYIGTAIYFILTLGSLYPTFYIFYYAYKTEQSLGSLPFSFYIAQVILFFIFFAIALSILSLFIKPWKGKKFLELDKIEGSYTKTDG